MTLLFAVDTEDNSKGRPTIINFFDGVAHYTFTGRHLREKTWDFLLEKAPAQVWACNAEYDLINMFGPWLGKLCTLQYVSAGLLRATLRSASVMFYDTLRHWPASVAEMGERLGLPKGQKDFRSVEYCRRDTEIVFRYVEEMLKRYAALGLVVKATLPSMALQLFKQFWPQPFDPLPLHTKNWLRDGYHGGRVEVYRFGEIRDGIRHYDINSLYPSVMVEQHFPDTTEYRWTYRPDFLQEGMAHVTVRLPAWEHPCLPFLYAGEIVYPYGRLTGTWTYPEIRQAMLDGGTVEKVHLAIEFGKTVRPFPAYVNYCYKEKESATNPIDRAFWKLMLNALYGKFGQKPGLVMIYQDRQFVLETDAPHANVIWSAYVTAYARLKLLRHLRACSDVFYTDTDSLFTRDRLLTGDALGDLRHVGTYRRVEFVGNKIYTLDGTAKAKGVPVAHASEFVKLGRAVYRKPARFRESRRTFATANVWYQVEKHLRKSYSKRIIYPDGSTAPWDLGQYQLNREWQR